MTDDGCEEMHLLIQADLDGELRPAEAARVAAHTERCAACAALQTRLVAQSAHLRQAAPYQAASDALRARVAASVAARTPVPAPRPAVRSPGRAVWFGGGFALAACLALLLVLPRGGDLPDAVVAAHVRALQPGHLVDVVSTDQHTVKPWFDGKLPFAPPVKDLAQAGFPLEGGRLDYLAGQPVAAMVYRRRAHVIDLFVWPSGSALDRVGVSGSRAGYHFRRWGQDGMTLWAVSDLDDAELDAFVRRWQGG